MLVTTIDARPRTRQLTREELEIIKKGEASLTAGPFSVMDKTGMPPSGDKHDYFSHRPYWWPNPKATNGLPYVQRDGQVNPDANTDRFDRVAYFAMSKHTRALASAYQLSGREEFAKHCALLIRTWFLSPETRMNPNFNCAQWRPGDKSGSSVGIIRGRTILGVMETIRMLEGSSAWTEGDATAWKRWLADYAKWLSTSKLGKDESRRTNNHGTWYDVQVATFAHHGGNDELARRVLKGVRKRIEHQVKPTGQMPEETGRTKSWNYSVMNLHAFLRLAALGKKLDVDLATYNGAKSGSIRDALDFLIPFAIKEKRWPYKQIKTFEPRRLLPVLELASELYDDPSLLETARGIETQTLKPRESDQDRPQNDK